MTKKCPVSPWQTILVNWKAGVFNKLEYMYDNSRGFDQKSPRSFSLKIIYGVLNENNETCSYGCTHLFISTTIPIHKDNLSSNRTSIRCDTGPQVCTLLGNWSGDSGSLHFTLVIHYHPCIVLEIYKHPVLPAKRFSLPNNYGRHHLLPELGFALLHRGHKHVTDTSWGKPIQTTLDAVNGDHVQILSAWNKNLI